MSFLRFMPSVEKVLPANSDRYVITCYQNEENYRTYISLYMYVYLPIYHMFSVIREKFLIPNTRTMTIYYRPILPFDI